MKKITKILRMFLRLIGLVRDPLDDGTKGDNSRKKES
jgi:uncharacterized membrane protein